MKSAALGAFIAVIVIVALVGLVGLWVQMRRVQDEQSKSF